MTQAHSREAVVPCALAVGGLDPGGGAGVLADLRAFHRAGAFGCAAVTLTTVQSTAGLRSVHVAPARQLVAQMREVLDCQQVRAIKVGALGSREIVRAVASELRLRRNIPVVVDTPLAPTRGGVRLVEARALSAIRGLLPLATLVTVNTQEAGALLGSPVRSLGEARDAAVAIGRGGVRAVLVKGGHLHGALATDVLLADGELLEVHARRLRGGAIHGTGCTLASLIAGRLAALGTGIPSPEMLVSVVRWAKRVHHATMLRAVRIGRGMRVMTP